MMKAYDDICATMRSWLNIDPSDTTPLNELARLLEKDTARRGHAGMLDGFVVMLADHIERERERNAK